MAKTVTVSARLPAEVATKLKRVAALCGGLRRLLTLVAELTDAAVVDALTAARSGGPPPWATQAPSARGQPQADLLDLARFLMQSRGASGAAGGRKER